MHPDRYPSCIFFFVEMLREQQLLSGLVYIMKLLAASSRPYLKKLACMRLLRMICKIIVHFASCLMEISCV